MRALVACLAFGMIGCSTQPPLSFDRVEIPPRRFVGQESRAERMGAGEVPVDDDATRAFLDGQIEQRIDAGPVKEPSPPEVVYVEVPGRYSHRYVYRYPRTYYDPYAGHRLTLEHTLLGAGLGAIIGHQSGRRDRGAAIGAGLGLLLDLAEH